MNKKSQCPCCQRGFREPAPPAPKGKSTPFRVLLEQAAERAGVTNAELSRRLDTNQSRVVQIFRADNLTERVFKETAAALGYTVEVKLVRRKA
jgi:hypothetical protein